MLDSLFFLAAIALIANGIAVSKRFFIFPSAKFPLPTWTGWDVLLLFTLYLTTAILIGPWIGLHLFNSPLFLLPLIQWITFFLTLFFFGAVFFTRAKAGLKWRWQRPDSPAFSKQVGTGLLIWLIAIPLVLALDEGLQWFNEAVMGVKGEEQLAVRYLKNSLNHPFSFYTALFSIIIAAPLIEEFLFRGVLQSWLKSRLGMKRAILLTSTCFALFHYASAQGISNIPIICSLFVFSLYLGFAYEKTGSLWTSITIHFAFNALGVAYILYTL